VEGDRGKVTLGREAIPKVGKFKYLGSIIEKKGDIDDDINHLLRWGGKNERMRLECYVTRKSLQV